MEIGYECLPIMLILLPIVGGLLTLPLAKRRICSPLVMLQLFTLIELLLSASLLFVDFPSDATPLITIGIPWVSELGLRFFLAIDRLSYPFLLLNGLMFYLCALYSNAHKPKEPLLFCACFLALEGILMGAFMAYDLLLFYIFWEALLIPMALIIGVFGAGQRIQAAYKFLLFTVFGSLPMLLAVIAIYLHQHAAGSDLSVPALYAMQLPADTQIWLFLACFLAFAVKFPLFPVHSWLPAAHVEAPTEGSVILAAILLKLGGYGLIRYAVPVFPEVFVNMLGFLAPFAVIAVIYASLLCLMQRHAKKLIAYSSISHMGFVALGVFSATFTGLQGGIYQMLNHGITTGALFFLIGMLYHRSERREIEEFGGLAAQTPLLAALFLVTALSSIGMPGLNSFVGEFMILLGLFKSVQLPYAWTIASIVVTSVIFGAAYLLWMYRRIFFGPLKQELKHVFHDLKPAELVVVVPLIVLMVLLGVKPAPILKFTEPVAAQISHALEEKVKIVRSDD